MTDQHNCQIGGFYPGAMGDSAGLYLSLVAKKDTFVVICPHDPQQMAVQVQECREHNWRLCYDIGQQVSNVSVADLQQGVLAAELVIVNDYEYSVLQKRTGWNEQELLNQVKTLVVTLGEQGSVIKQQGQADVSVKAVTVKKVVDPTGAGDAYRAGFLYGYIRDWPVVECARLGSVVASYVLAQHGAQEHTFTRNEIEKKYTSTYGENLRW